jgi:hypothetical protein
MDGRDLGCNMVKRIKRKGKREKNEFTIYVVGCDEESWFKGEECPGFVWL